MNSSQLLQHETRELLMLQASKAGSTWQNKGTKARMHSAGALGDGNLEGFAGAGTDTVAHAVVELPGETGKEEIRFSDGFV